ncbi:hypothetical protein RB597_006617 [Gaeumannomyces tritici]
MQVEPGKDETTVGLTLTHTYSAALPLKLAECVQHRYRISPSYSPKRTGFHHQADMSAAQAVPRAAAAKGSAKPNANKGAQNQNSPKVYARLHFEFSDGKGYDIATLQSTDGNTKLALDPDGQLKWELGLGASLKFNCGTPSDETSYIARLPKGFHVIIDPKKGERFIVGHVGGTGRDFWYRSVAEFVPHLLWLSAPAPHDRARCSCEPCKKMLGKPKAKETKKATAAAKRKAAATAAPRTAPASATPAAASTSSTAPAGAAAVAAKATAAPTESPVSTSAQPVPPTPAAVAIPAEAPVEHVDVPDHSIYRVGEMVWFGSQTGVWRLGVIAAPHRSTGTPSTDTWVVAPLGHAMLRQESCTKSAAEMKPFLAFSLPSIDVPQLQGMTFAEVDWASFVQQYAGSDPHKRQVAGLEASKIAAKDASVSYSTFNRTADGYGGVFLGPELVRLGDGVRVRRYVGELDGGVDIMEVKRITDAPGGQHLTFSGDVWRLHVSPFEAPPPPASSQPAGPVFVRQLETYNEVLRLQGGRVDWLLVEQGAERSEEDVHGRFYVTFDLLPEMRDSVVADNPPEDGTALLNLRLRPGETFYLGRRESRKATFGNSLCVDFGVGRGIVEG